MIACLAILYCSIQNKSRFSQIVCQYFMCPKSERSSAECIHHTEIVAEIKTSAQQQVLSLENCFCVLRYGNWDSSGYCFDKSKELKL
jgi:hypothetical protein